MTGLRLHHIWFLHQPAFIPDAEIVWRIDSTYMPLLDALAEHGIPCSLGITGSLLERCASLRPDFIDDLADAAAAGRITLLGTTGFHPVLPWWSTAAGAAQIQYDLAVKAGLGLPVADVFWPTELAWSMRVGTLARAHGYRSVVVDHASRDAARMLPRWSDDEQGLRPHIDIPSLLGSASKIGTHVPGDERAEPLTLWVRDRRLSRALLQAMNMEHEDEHVQLASVMGVLREVQRTAHDRDAPLLMAEDGERFLPNRLARFLRLLDLLRDGAVGFVNHAQFASSPSDDTLAYVPASTMEGTDAMWSATIDDTWYRSYLGGLSARLERCFDLRHPRTESERRVRDTLLRAQDSSFYFWHYVPRTRTGFYEDAHAVERWIEQAEHFADPRL